MGRMYAEGIRESGLDLHTMIHWHLTGNHFPPVPTSMVEPCIEAINAVNEGDYDREVELPEGVTYKGRDTAPAWAIVDQHHLDTFLQREDEE